MLYVEFKTLSFWFSINFHVFQIGNKIQGFFARRGSTRVRSMAAQMNSDDSDDSDKSDGLEYDNLGFNQDRRVSRADILFRQRDGRLMTLELLIYYISRSLSLQVVSIRV